MMRVKANTPGVNAPSARSKQMELMPSTARIGRGDARQRRKRQCAGP
jgi:hypothetical protein